MRKPLASTALGSIRSPIPWLVLAISLSLAFWAWRATTMADAEVARARFDRHVESISSSIHARMVAHEQTLRSGAAVFAVKTEIHRADWAAFVAALDLSKSYPGIQAMGVSVRVPAAERAAQVRRVRAEGFPDYDIRPPGERAEYHPIVFNEPMTGRNAKALGFDINSDPMRREAMKRARDSGDPAISGRVVLAGEAFRGPQPAQAGFVMYQPLYRTGATLDSFEARRDALRGFVFAPFRMGDLMPGVVGAGTLQRVRVEIFDGPQIDAEKLLFDSHEASVPAGRAHKPSFERPVAIEVAQRLWTLRLSTEPLFDFEVASIRAVVVLAAGATTSLILFALASALVAARMRATEQSLRDPLTGLYNRRHLDDMMSREIPRARRSREPIGVVLIDLDRFKQLNDQFGHDAGDFALREFAMLVERNTRREDIACRMGGEEFAIVMPGATLEAARSRAESIRAALERLPLEFRGRDMSATLSAGVAAFPSHGDSWAEVIQHADRALYAAKLAGRNQVVLA
jgi:diguanylate cyclase